MVATLAPPEVDLAHEPARRRPTSRRRPGWWLPLALSVAGLVSIALGLHQVNPATESSTGLISLIGPWYLIGLVALTAGFVLGLVRRDSPRWLAGAQVVAMVVVVGGLGSLVEPYPRLAVTYTHLGFARYLATHGTALPPIDARAGWPGAFALIAELETLVGDPSGFTIGRWAPLVFDLIDVAPLLVLMAAATRDVRARWLAVWIFFLANWVEQDYLSPQALDFTLYLSVLAVLVVAFGPRGALGPTRRRRLARAARSWRARWLEPGWLPPTPARSGYSGPQRAGLLALVVAISLAMTMSHQLTPYVLILDSVLLVAIGRCRLGTLPWLLVLMAAAWLSFGAASFWTGHLGLLTGSAGNVAGNVTTGVSDRIRGDPGHLLVLTSRIFIVLLLAAAAVLGAVRQRLVKAEQPWLAVMALAPVLLVGVQSYGGEVVIRTFLFSLPFLCALAAAAVFPGRGATTRPLSRPMAALARLVGRFAPAWGARTRRAVLAVALVGASAASLLSVVAHYGADQYEGISPPEAAAVAWFYAHVPPGANVFTVCVNLPWRYTGAADYDYHALVADNYGHPLRELDRLVSPRYGAYFIASDSQAICGEQMLGLPSDWLTTLEAGLVATGHTAVVYDHDGARIFHIVPSSQQSDQPPGGTP